MNELQALESTIEILDTYGWQQGNYGGERAEQGPHCLVGALLASTVDPGGTHEDFDHYQAFAKARAHLSSMIGGTGSHLPLIRWNDTPGRTKAEVKQLLVDAIAQVKAEAPK